MKNANVRLYPHGLVKAVTRKVWVINDDNEVVAGYNIGEGHCLADEPKTYVVVDAYLGEVYTTETIFKTKEEALEVALKTANANVQKTK